MKAEVQDRSIIIDKLRKENEMLNAKVEEKIETNCRLETERQTWMKYKDRLYFQLTDKQLDNTLVFKFVQV